MKKMNIAFHRIRLLDFPSRQRSLKLLSIFLISSFAIGLLPLNAQTLGEVVRAAQRRTLLGNDAHINDAKIEKKLYELDWEIEAPDSMFPPVVDKIPDFGIGTIFPSDSVVDALPITKKIETLRMLWVAYNSNEYPGVDINIENYSSFLEVLASKLSRKVEVKWSGIYHGREFEYYSGELSSKPSFPVVVPNFESFEPEAWEDFMGSAVDFNAGIGSSGTNSSGNVTYGSSVYGTFADSATVFAPQSFSGTMRVRLHSGQTSRVVSNLDRVFGENIYEPAKKLLWEKGVSKSEEVILDWGIGSYSLGPLTFYGREYGPYNSWDQPVCLAAFPTQPSLILVGDGGWEGPFYWLDWYDLAEYHVFFEPHFGAEFFSPRKSLNSELPQLEVVPDFPSYVLKVRLSDTLADLCEIRFFLSPGLAPSRSNVSGIGGEFVYSSSPEDREPEYVWQGHWLTKNKRWDRFDDYLAEWWKEVIVQVKSRGWCVNIRQEDRYSYAMEFFRPEQVGNNDAETGKYSFSGNPVETWKIENPAQDDGVVGRMKITTGKGVYEIDSVSENDGIHWTFRFDDLQGTRILSEDVSVWAPKSIGSNPSVFVSGTMVKESERDGEPLPTITAVYAEWERRKIDTLVESSSDGIVTSSYVYEDDPGRPLKQITQTGGKNPFVATFDHGLLAHYVSGPLEIQVSYQGSSVIETQKINGNTISTVTTTYNEDLSSATTTISNAPGSTSALEEYYPGTDAVLPWAPKMIRGFDGMLTTFSYVWNGDDLVITQERGRGADAAAKTVIAGTKTITKINSAGKVFSTEDFDIESEAKLDFSIASQYQAGTFFPTQFTRPLGSEGFSYDGQGRVLSFTDLLGKTTDLTRDPLGRIIKSVRNGVTTDIEYNPGGLGQKTTVSGSGLTTQVLEEISSPFGMSQTAALTGPENIEITRTESPTSVTTVTTNSTTGENVTETVQKGNLATSISGNAVEPVNLSYTFGAGWTQKVTHAGSASLTMSTAYDALGRLTKVETPSPTGSGVAGTKYGYAGGLLATVTGPSGIASVSHLPDGSFGGVSQGGRTMAMSRAGSSASEIVSTVSDGAGVLWKTSVEPLTGVTKDVPIGNSALLWTTTPDLSGDLLTLSGTGAGGSRVSTWKDGAPYAGSSSGAGSSSVWSAASNKLGVMESLTIKPGGISGNATTTSFSELGLPTGMTGLVSAEVSNSFGSNGLTQTVTRNGHSQTTVISPKGNLMGRTGYGKPDEVWSEPSYGSAGVTRTLTTAAGAVQFTWNLAGLLIERKFPDGSKENYSYAANGGLATWTTPRASFALAPNEFGEPTQLGNMGSFGYDNVGRINLISDKAGTRTLSYENRQLDTVTYTSGILAGKSVDRDYDSLGRLHQVVFSGKTVTYSYNPSTGVLAGITTAGGATGSWSNFDPVSGKAKNFALGPVAVSTAYDGLGRVTTHGANGLNYSYGWSADGICDSVSGPNGSWTLGYDSYGYLHTATGWKNFSYNFDEAGRPASATDYRPTVRINSSTVTVFGSLAPAATLMINSATIATGTTGTFSQTYTPTASTWQTFTVRGTLAAMGINGSDAVAEEVRKIFIPPSSETLTYDASGNRSGDARWTQSWNDLEQLTAIEDSDPESTWTRVKLECIYDVQGRRVQKTVRVGGVVSKRTTTLWDGWRPVMEVDYSADNAELARRFYTWGPDVSGTLEGAAGIGGLVEILEEKGATTTRSLPLYDGIGNIIALVDGDGGGVVAEYKYGPFGEVVGVSGERADSCPFRYQTKIYDPETGYYYFGKRYYDPSTQSWLSRDPLREGGGVNLYAYCGNKPVGSFDPIGLEPIRMSLGSARFLTEMEKVRQMDLGIGVGPSRTEPMFMPSALVPDVDYGGSPSVPTGSGFAHQVTLHGWSFMNNLYSSISLGADPSRLLTGQQSFSAGVVSEEYARRFSYGERSMADFNFFIAGLYSPLTVRGGVGMFNASADALSGIRWTAGGRRNLLNYRPVYEGLTTGGLPTGWRYTGPGKGPIHHIATNKNLVSTLRGGPWTPRFEGIFKKAGMTLEDAANKLQIPGHLGPHPEAYHQMVFDRLISATQGLKSPAYGAALRAELNAIAIEAQTSGSIINNLLIKP